MVDTTLNQFVSRGTNAERLAFTPDPGTPASGNDPGYFFYETDTGNTYAWDGSAWDAVGGGATTGLSTSLSQVSSSLSSEISSRASGDTSLSTVISGSISTTLSTAASATASLSTAVGSGGGTSYEFGPVTAPTTADLATWDNQGTSTATDGTGAMILKPQVDGVMHGRYKTAPSTPYDVYCRVDHQWLSTAAVTVAVKSLAGILFKDTGGDNERFAVGVYAERVAGDEQHLYAIVGNRYSGASPPVLSTSSVVKFAAQPWQWVRVNNDGTTLTIYASMDGKNWITVGTETLAAYIDGAASYGVFAMADANATEAVSVFSYFSTTAPA